MKELLIAFILCLIIGSVINGFATIGPTPEPKANDAQNSSSNTVTELSDSTFNDSVLQSQAPVLVDFYATWCGPCKYMAPIVEQIAGEYAGKVRVYKVNVDNNPALAQKYDVSSFPRFLIFKNGQLTQTFIGSQPKEALTSALDHQMDL